MDINRIKESRHSLFTLSLWRRESFGSTITRKLNLPLFLIALYVVLFIFISSACQVRSQTNYDKSKVYVGIVFIGGKDDRSFNSTAWEGIKNARQDFPIVLHDAEPNDYASFEPVIRAFAERRYDLIIGVGSALTSVIEQVAKDYPDSSFAIVDGVIDQPNVASLVFKEHQGSYLVGMIAGTSSQTGTIGFIGGKDIPLIHKFRKGFEEGAYSVNPSIHIITNYIGVTDIAWDDPGKCKELAIAQMGKGADVIFAVAGNSGIGAFDAVEEYNKFVIGVDSNQNWIKPGFVLTSMVKRIDIAVYQIVRDKLSGKFQGGIHVYGLENNGVGYALDQYNEKLISPDVLQKVEVAKQKIISGQIEVTDMLAK